ncbi:dTDP-4-dehydrorhamnose reductase [Chitinilyticum litopenaei]|uniref:dTDP-4-dehydrorhamnose reductase n=1 Tax=Chitinilyticum litopenaei TaxID=1121276 RepID=UPI000408983C|nr:dTDP-4-dehydrorhamnose reductase [Chitinilyticum litopenaei]
MTFPKILLTGAAGQVGFELQRTLGVLGEVIAIDRTECDLADAAAIRQLLDAVQPDLIVNPAAYTAVDKAEGEPELAQAINADVPAVFANWAAAHDVLLVHYSTDYVFDGRKAGWYGEDAQPNPQSVYGKTKLAGEEAIRASGCRHLILRTSWVFGAHGGNFLKTMLRLMQEREALNVVADQIGAPTSAALLADCTAQILARYLQAGQPAGFPFGTYHLVAAGETSWHGYALETHRLAGLHGYTLRCDGEAIRPIPTSAYPSPAPRPANSRLATDKLQSTFNLRLPPWQDGVRQVMTLLAR